MPRPEKIIVNTGLTLFILSALLEGLSRVGNRPDLHAIARWFVLGALCVVFIPLGVVVVVLAFQKLFAHKKGLHE